MGLACGFPVTHTLYAFLSLSFSPFCLFLQWLALSYEVYAAAPEAQLQSAAQAGPSAVEAWAAATQDAASVAGWDTASAAGAGGYADYQSVQAASEYGESYNGDTAMYGFSHGDDAASTSMSHDPTRGTYDSAAGREETAAMVSQPLVVEQGHSDALPSALEAVDSQPAAADQHFTVEQQQYAYNTGQQYNGDQQQYNGDQQYSGLRQHYNTEQQQYSNTDQQSYSADAYAAVDQQYVAGGAPDADQAPPQQQFGMSVYPNAAAGENDPSSMAGAVNVGPASSVTGGWDGGYDPLAASGGSSHFEGRPDPLTASGSSAHFEHTRRVEGRGRSGSVNSVRYVVCGVVLAWFGKKRSLALLPNR